jgi:hypothetical protein
VPRLDRVEERAVGGVKFLITMSPGAGVVQYIVGLAMEVGITGIYSTEISEQGYEMALSMKDAIAHTMDFRDLGPRKNLTNARVIEKSYGRH